MSQSNNGEIRRDGGCSEVGWEEGGSRLREAVIPAVCRLVSGYDKWNLAAQHDPDTRPI